MINLRNKAKNRYLWLSTSLDYSHYKFLINVTTTIINNEKKAYFNHFSSNKSKKLWKELHNLSVINCSKNESADIII